MEKTPKPFKKVPKKYHPKGLTILYEDRDILVVDKACGLLTISTDKVKEHTAHYLLNDYVRKGNHKSKHRVFIVHRLDRDTSGVIVFAKSELAKRYLQDAWQGFEKKYHAVIHGTLPEKEGVITSYLSENKAHKVFAVADSKQGTLAKTGYKVLRESGRYSLLEIELLTGKKNQIRVHLADQGCPVVGDKKYGEKKRNVRRLTLHASSLTLVHPHTKKKMTFATKIPAYFDALMKGSRAVR